MARWRYNSNTGLLTRAGIARGHRNKEGRLFISFKGKPMPATHLIWFIKTGTWPKSGFVIDHINGDPSDDRWCNLRHVPHSFNVIYANKKFRFDGKHYHAIVHYNKKRYNLGKYDTNEEALQVRNDFLTTLLI